MYKSELDQTAKGIFDFVQYVLRVAIQSPILLFGVILVLLAGKGSKNLKLGKVFNLKI